MVASDILTNACLLRRTHTCSGAAVGEKWLSQSGAYAISYVVAVFPTLPIVRSAQLSPVWRFLMSCPVGCQPTCWPAGLPLLCLLRFSHCHRRCYPVGAALHGLLQGLVGLGEGVPTGWGWSQWWLPEPMAPKKTAKEQQQHEAPPPCTTKVALTVQDFVSAFQYPPFRWLFITNMCNAVCKCSSSMTMSQALARLQLIRTPSHRPSLPRSVLLAWAGRLSQQQTLASQAFSSSTGFRTRLVRMASAC
jgi:hypothetical protein